MGTNFYRRRIPTTDDYLVMMGILDSGLLEVNKVPGSEIVKKLKDHLKKFEDKVHICKFSYGWKTNFDHNWGKYYQPSRKSLEDFLSEPGTEIVDEYETIYTPEEFWKKVDEWNNKDGFITDRDTLYGGDYYSCTYEKEKCLDLFGIHTPYNDFEVDGLIFMVYSDFE